jgi:hypothetical protein
MVLTACDVGLGFGVFPSMQLLHLIPKERLTEDYLVRLTRAMNVSGLILDSMRTHKGIEIPSLPYRCARALYFFFFKSRRDRRFAYARTAAQHDAAVVLQQLKQSPGMPQAQGAQRS